MNGSRQRRKALIVQVFSDLVVARRLSQCSVDYIHFNIYTPSTNNSHIDNFYLPKEHLLTVLIQMISALLTCTTLISVNVMWHARCGNHDINKSIKIILIWMKLPFISYIFEIVIHQPVNAVVFGICFPFSSSQRCAFIYLLSYSSCFLSSRLYSHTVSLVFERGGDWNARLTGT